MDKRSRSTNNKNKNSNRSNKNSKNDKIVENDDLKIRYRHIKDNKISIFKNMIINNGSINAYYVLYPYNYKVMDDSSSETHITRLYNVLSNLHQSLGEVKLSMFKLRNIVSKEETIASIIKTVKMYKKDYNDMPPEYKRYIKNISQDFSILAIQIDVKNTFDIENQSLIEIVKTTLDNFFKENFSMNNVNIDEHAVAAQNIRIANILNRYAVPANEKLVMNIYVNSLFPSYNLIYNDYLVNHSSAILTSLKQEIIPHLGWFELSNSGMVSFGGTPRVTYGCVLTILEFPEVVRSENFNLGISGLHVNMNLLSKEKALLKFKRMRADVKEEFEEAMNANNTDSTIDEEMSLAERAVKSIKTGRIATEIDANILVTAETKAELDAKKKHIVSILSDANVVCSIAGNQARAFIDSFVKNAPRKYDHIMDLEYAISFQLDDGVLVGDQDSKFAAPVVGNG